MYLACRNVNILLPCKRFMQNLQNKLTKFAMDLKINIMICRLQFAVNALIGRKTSMNLIEVQANLIKAQQDYISVLLSYSGAQSIQQFNAIATTSTLPAIEAIPTFSTYADKFLQKKQLTMKESGYYNYYHKLKTIIIPYFCDFKLNEINQNILQEFIFAKKEHYSPKSIRDIIMVVKSVLFSAEEDGIIKVPKIRLHYPEMKNEEYRILTDDEYTKLYKWLENHMTQSSAGVLIAMETGMRIGEVCGLKWSDVDFDKGTIQVRRTVSRVYMADSKTSKIVIGNPKTLSGNRTIPMPKRFAEILIRKKADCENENAFVCTNFDQPTEPRTLRQYYDRQLKKLGIPRVTFHALRHGFATRCVEAGIDPKTVAAIMGHKNCDITLDVYTSCTTKMKQNAIQKLDENYWMEESKND